MADQLNIAGVRLDYRLVGPSPADAPTLVLLHEGLGCIEMWRDFPQHLSDATGFGVLAYSRAGYGGSDPAVVPRPLDYMTREATAVLPKVLDAVGFRRGVLVGHSDGATIAAIYAGSVIDHRVRGAVLMAPHFFTEPHGLQSIAAARHAFSTSDLRAKLAKYHPDPDHTFFGWNDAWLAPDFRAWSVADVIDYIRVPVLAIQGADDQYGTLAQIDELDGRCYAPVDRLILDGCGHSPHIDRADAVLDAIADYCARLQRIEAAKITLV